MILKWTWDSPYKNIRIYEGEDLIGIIKDFNSKTINQIYEDEITVERQGTFGQHVYFIDPADNKAYYKYNFENIVSEKRTCEVIERTLYEVIKGEIKPGYKKIVELKIKRNYFFRDFKNSGELIIYGEDKSGINIFLLFFNYFYKHRGN